MPLAVAAALLAGFGYAALRAQIRLAEELPRAWEGEDIEIVGVVDDLPAVSAQGTRFAFAVERVRTPHAVVPSRLSLAWFAPLRPVFGDEDVPVVHAGERWVLTVRLKRPHGTVNPGGFDLEAWLLQQGLRATGYVHPEGLNARSDFFAGRPGDYVQRARERVRQRIVAALGDAPYAGVIVALAIGDQRAVPEAQWTVFNRTGISHLVSISGLHVTVFAAFAGGLAYALARRSARLTARLPARKLAAAVGVVAAGSYVLLAGAAVPAVRTFAMLAIAACGLWWGRPGTAGVVWLWALAGVLLWDPWATLTPGFWLSFGAVGLLLYASAGRLRAATPAGLRARLRDTHPRRRACAVGGDAGTHAADAGAVPAGVADRAGRQRRGHSGRHARRRAARAARHRRAGRPAVPGGARDTGVADALPRGAGGAARRHVAAACAAAVDCGRRHRRCTVAAGAARVSGTRDGDSSGCCRCSSCGPSLRRTAPSG